MWLTIAFVISQLELSKTTLNTEEAALVTTARYAVLFVLSSICLQRCYVV